MTEILKPNDSADQIAGRKIHMLMWDMKLSQRKLAPQLGLTQSTLSKKIRGECGWSIAELLTVARELNTSVAYLVGESSHPRSAEPVALDASKYTPWDLNPEPTD